MIVACPTCGASVEFRYDDSLVRVCGSCRAAVTRTDRGVASLGAVADLAPSSSPLRLWLEGRLPHPGAPRGLGFMLVGRAQLRHGAGGTWDEWYAKFDDGRWGWVAESQGRVHVLFEVVGAGATPRLDALVPNGPVLLAGRRWTVAELGEATALACEGELPYRFVPGARGRFADLGDGAGGFATLDYGDDAPPGDDTPPGPPVVYLGRQVTLAELGWAQLEAAPAPAARPAQGRALTCPACGGALELRAEGTLRLGCPYCDALLEPGHGAVTLVARQQRRVRPPFPLGSVARFDGVDFTLIGHVRRAALDGLDRWAFDEYLLHAPAIGYRWLVCSDGHWTFVTTLPAGTIATDWHATDVRYEGARFRLLSRLQLEVEAVHGEAYWRIEVGQRVLGCDFVAPPAMLSCEVDTAEVNWSLGRYLTVAEVRAAFGEVGASATLPDPADVGACQPFRHGEVLAATALAGTVALLLGLVAAFTADHRLVLDTRVMLDGAAPGDDAAVRDAAAPLAEVVPPPPAEGAAAAEVFFSAPFRLRARENVELRLAARLDNEWISVGGDLVDEATGYLRSFDVDLDEWNGVEGGTAWREGSPSAAVNFPAMPAGSYVLRLEVVRAARSAARRHALEVTLYQDVFRTSHLLLLLGLIGVPGLVAALRRYVLEKRRRDNATIGTLDVPAASHATGAS